MTALRRFAARLSRNRRGNVAILTAGGLTMLAATSALGIDTASLFLEKRRLQGVADAAAIAAADDPYGALARAEAVIRLDPAGRARVIRAEAGRYDADAVTPAADRFVAAPDGANAARITVEGGVTTIFGRALGLSPRTTITARATAARMDGAAISIGSRLAAVDGGVANAVLSGLTGSELHLTAMDYAALAGGDVELLTWFTALRSRLGFGVASFGDVLAADIALPTALEAMADATTGGDAAATLRALARRVPTRTVTLRDVIDLGPLTGATTADPDRPIRVGTIALLREAVLIGGEARMVRVALASSVPGVSSARLRIEIGERPARSPWLAVGRSGAVTVRTAQARILLTTTLLDAAPFGLGTVHLPFVAELAQAEARLVAIDCSRATGRAAMLDALPALGTAAIGDPDEASFADHRVPLTIRRTAIARGALASVTALSSIRLGGTQPERLRFDAADVAAGAPRTVSTTGIVGGVAASLIRDADIRVDVLGLGLSGSAIAAALGTLLAAVAPSVDALVDQTTALAGVRVGQADVWVNGLRCGAPVLVG